MHKLPPVLLGREAGSAVLCEKRHVTAHAWNELPTGDWRLVKGRVFPARFNRHLQATRVARRQRESVTSKDITLPACLKQFVLREQSQADMKPKTRRPDRQVPKLVLNSRDGTPFQHFQLPMPLKICFKDVLRGNRRSPAYLRRALRGSLAARQGRGARLPSPKP